MDKQLTPRNTALSDGPSLNSEPDAEAGNGGFDSVFVAAAGPMLLLDDDRRLWMPTARRAPCSA